MSRAAGLANILKLQTFFKQMDLNGDWDDFINPDGTDLNKTRIAEAVGLASRKTLTEGKEISKIYRDKINILLEQGILNNAKRRKIKISSNNIESENQSAELKRANKIAEINLILEEELYQARKKIERLESKIKLFEKIENYIEQTGRW